MKLSIIVPIYNAEKTLHKCVDSILSQEYPKIEIILVDDGSTDNSLKICNEYACKDSRVIVYHKENEGLVAARKSGVKIATGDYIGFVDSDDFIDSDMYSQLMEKVNENNSDIVIGGIISDYYDRSIKTYNNIERGYYDRKAIEDKIIPNMLIKTRFFKFEIIPGVVVKVFKKNVIEQALECVYNDITIGEDVAITSFAMMSAKSVSIIEAATYHYIQTETSMIRGYNPKRFDDICRLYECVSRIEEPSYKKQLGLYFACVLYGVLSDCANNKQFSKKERINKVKELLSDDITVRALKNVDVSMLAKRDKIKVMLMKFKMAGAIYAIIKR